MKQRSCLLRLFVRCLVAALVAGFLTGRSGSADSPDLDRLKIRLERFLSWQQGRWGIYVIDLRSGRRTGVKADQVFPAASTYKIPIAMYILDQVVQRKASSEETVAYTPDDYDPGEGVLHETAPGTPLSVRVLIDLMIRYSDNIARNMLLRRFGEQNVYRYAVRLGAETPPLDASTPGTTPREMAKLLEHLYGGVVPDEVLSDWLLELLSTTRFENRIAAGVPKGVCVAHKIGTRPGVVHDVGIVFVPGQPFLLAVFSDGVDEEEAEKVIVQVTREVYREFALQRGAQLGRPDGVFKSGITYARAAAPTSSSLSPVTVHCAYGFR